MKIMSSLRMLASAVGLAVLVASPSVFAQPDRHHGQGYKPPKYSSHHNKRRPEYQPSYGARHPSPARVVHHAPPRHFKFARDDFRRHAHKIHRGPALPPHVRVVHGHPLPRGYGRVVSYEHHHYLPHYAGYEWRSVGRDLVLVAATTGIVYAIVDNILN